MVGGIRQEMVQVFFKAHFIQKKAKKRYSAQVIPPVGINEHAVI